jgi:hypothetical protein
MKFKIRVPQLAVLHDSSNGRSDLVHHALNGEITLFKDTDEPEILKITGYTFNETTQEYSAEHGDLSISFKNKHVQNFTPLRLIRNKKNTYKA